MHSVCPGLRHLFPTQLQALEHLLCRNPRVKVKLAVSALGSGRSPGRGEAGTRHHHRWWDFPCSGGDYGIPSFSPVPDGTPAAAHRQSGVNNIRFLPTVLDEGSLRCGCRCGGDVVRAFFWAADSRLSPHPHMKGRELCSLLIRTLIPSLGPHPSDHISPSSPPKGTPSPNTTSLEVRPATWRTHSSYNKTTGVFLPKIVQNTWMHLHS